MHSFMKFAEDEYEQKTATSTASIDPQSRDVVDFTGPDDPYNPINWPFWKKVYTSLLYSLTSVGSVWASTAYAPANHEVAQRFGVSDEVALLGTSLLLVGWAIGPLVWGPMSEVYGRKWPVVLPFFVATMFSFVTASANSIQTVLITRFLTGFFGCASITCTGGVFVDLWDSSQRGNAIVGYTFAVCWIPSIAPVVGGAIIVSGIDWRWTEYLTGILQAAILLLVAFTVEESYVPILLSTRAKQLRRETGKETLHAAANEIDTNFKDLAIKFGLRPIQMLATPICLFVTIYSSFIYGLFYASLESFPIIYQQTRGWNEVVGSLPFLVVGLGIIVGVALNVWNQGHYMRAYEANNCVSVPEARLPPMMIASIALPAGLFIMGWTSSQSIPWIAPIIGTFLMGFGYYVIFTSATSYLVDVFQRWGASAIAANTFTRSAFAAGLPLIVPYMYSRLGNGWAFSVLGFFSVLHIPVPFVFWKYGARVRKMGKYTANMG